MKALTTVENTIVENMNYAQATMNKCESRRVCVWTEQHANSNLALAARVGSLRSLQTCCNGYYAYN